MNPAIEGGEPCLPISTTQILFERSWNLRWLGWSPSFDGAQAIADEVIRAATHLDTSLRFPAIATLKRGRRAPARAPGGRARLATEAGRILLRHAQAIVARLDAAAPTSGALRR
jgi:hypothetical protein